MESINTNRDLKTFDHISFYMAGSNFGPECRYLSYVYLNVNKTKTVLKDLVNYTYERAR